MWVCLKVGRLYHVRYIVGGMGVKKHKILTTNVDGRSAEIFIPENDAVILNVNKVETSRASFFMITLNKSMQGSFMRKVLKWPMFL